MQKAFVGLSGGVDSSVAAYLLKKEGFDVYGVFIKVWQPEFVHCTWEQDRTDAMRVCAKLGIPFLSIDLSETYKKQVIDYMIAEYAKGRTPNPDVLCNETVKFGAFYDWARSKGADIVATGHYARIQDGNLLRGVDPKKDQSYFLWKLKKEQLGHIRFPVGGLKKEETRKIAERAGLNTAAKKDSQGLCFVGALDMREFISHYVPKKLGAVLNSRGEAIGEHYGAHLYTIGERHGFRIHKGDEHSTPQYVIQKDLEANTITVGDRPSRDNRTLELQDINWFVDPAPIAERTLSAQVRYHQEPIECKVDGNTVSLKNAAGDIAEGQSCVVYDGEKVVLGGVIAQIR